MPRRGSQNFLIPSCNPCLIGIDGNYTDVKFISNVLSGFCSFNGFTYLLTHVWGKTFAFQIFHKFLRASTSRANSIRVLGNFKTPITHTILTIHQPRSGGR
jgi:hypothetical protein